MSALPAARLRPSRPPPRERRRSAGLRQAGAEALVLAFSLPQRPPPAGQPTGTRMSDGFAPDGLLSICPNGAIVLSMSDHTVGRGLYAAAALLAAEQLQIGLDQLRIEVGHPPLADLQVQPLPASASPGGWEPLRCAAAAARELLLCAAARRWSVDPTSCQLCRGEIRHEPSRRSAGFGSLATDAACLPLPAEAPGH